MAAQLNDSDNILCLLVLRKVTEHVYALPLCTRGLSDDGYSLIIKWLIQTTDLIYFALTGCA